MLPFFSLYTPPYYARHYSRTKRVYSIETLEFNQLTAMYGSVNPNDEARCKQIA